MPTATLTSKGQVTIPKAVREALDLRAGDRIDFIVTTSGDTVLRPLTKRVDDVYGMLYRPGLKPLTDEELDAAIAKKVREDFG